MSVIIVVGLPVSGKSIYIKNNSIDCDIIYDNFITKFNNKKIIMNLKNDKNDKKIYLIDPRLCNFKTFSKYVEYIQEYVEKKDISLILFKNEKNKCLENLQKYRNNNQSLYKSIINFYSNIYDLNNYSEYNSVIQDVYYE